MDIKKVTSLVGLGESGGTFQIYSHTYALVIIILLILFFFKEKNGEFQKIN